MTVEDGERVRLANEAELLRANVQTLVGHMEAVSNSIKVLERYGKVNRSITLLVLSGFVLFIIMVGGLSYIVNNQLNTTNRLVAIEQEQTIEKTKALCPLYQLFINNDTPKTRENQRNAAISNGLDPASIDKSWSTLHESYVALNCQSITAH